MRRLSVCVVALLVFGSPARASQDEPLVSVAVHQGQPKAVPVEQAKPETPKAPIPEIPRPGQFINIRLDVMITDQRATGQQPTTKTVSLVLADRSAGRIRTTGDVRTPQGYRPIHVNVDANAEFIRDGRVRAQVTLEYRPTIGEATAEEQVLTTISESFAVILEDGKPLVVSQSADPNSERRVRVEVKATILK
jgi:hypothetical protein